ncbi:hypothetical protein OIU84_028888 [Salix udensis]|uniref:Phytocyanin domain-containing protein n=1 Tax=Salix udensis TaxID=889485 RepID=A0AAD6P9V0_9ROSI|nr:hypothetical protein OIU84_028888 [Salix udensis]
MEDSGRTTVRKTVRSMAITAVTVMVILECAAAAEQLHKVGSRGWIPDYNYTDWLNQRHEHFYVGDWLLFVFDKHSYNVLEVNETNYENCNDQRLHKEHYSRRPGCGSTDGGKALLLPEQWRQADDCIDCFLCCYGMVKWKGLIGYLRF